MADTGWISASAGANSGTVAWSNASNITTSNNARASVSLSGSESGYLMAAFAGISANVPVDATIDGIALRVEGYTSSAVDFFEAYLGTSVPALMDGGTAVKDLAGSIPRGSATSEAVVEVGGAADLWSQSSISRATLADSAFRVLLYANDADSTVVYVDHIQIKVHYTYTPPVESEDSLALFWSAP
jgi:hypothetical protein